MAERFNIGDFGRYLSTMDAEPEAGVPKGVHIPSLPGTRQMAAAAPQAKTALKKTLAEHDKVYHKGGYKDGDTCNFREALMKGDGADELAKAEKEEGAAKLGLVKYTEDKDGNRTVLGIEEVAAVSAKNGK